jgi:hypothetical protein
MFTAARLTLRLYRFELLAILVYGLVLAALAVIVGVRLQAAYPGVDCMRQWRGAPAPPGCESTEVFFGVNEAEAGKVMAAMWLLPLAAGVSAGSVLVAREIEHRTAQFAWSVGTSRRRWFLDRTIPVSILAVGAVLLAAGAAEFLEGSRTPWMNPLTSGQDFGLRGPTVVALAFAAFGVSVLVGALIGRMLPALILAGVLTVGMRTAVGGLVPFGVPVTVLPDSIFSDIVGSGDADTDGDVSTYPLITGGAWQGSDGRLLGFDEASAIAPSGPGAEDPGLWLSRNGTFVSLGVPGPNIWQVELRESVVFVAIGLIGLVGSALVVERRRPY